MENYGDQPQLTRTNEFREYENPEDKVHGLRHQPESVVQDPLDKQQGLNVQPETTQQDRGIGAGFLHRSGSSSSSEDDGEGGRRKKGLKEKIQDKLHHGVQGQQGDSQRPEGYTESSQVTGEKKSMLDKIKEKVPGKH